MATNTDLQSVKEFRVKKTGGWSTKEVFLTMILSFVGALAGGAIDYGVMILTNFDLMVVTPALIGGGALLGASSRQCKSMWSFILAIIPATAVCWVMIWPELQFVGESSDLMRVFDAVCLALIPFGLIFNFHVTNFCVKCGIQFLAKDILRSETASPYKVLALLRDKTPLPDSSELDASDEYPSYSDQTEVVISALYCPQCNDSVVNGTLHYKKDKEMLFFSELWLSDSLQTTFPGEYD